MMLSKGHLRAREAETAADLQAAQRLRWLAFMGKRGASDDGTAVDADDCDADCRHVLIEDRRSGQLLATFRFLHLHSGAEIDRPYSARHYDLDRLRDFPGPMVEMGRFCIHPDRHDPDIVRIAWAAMTRFVEESGIEMLFGCSSFIGTDPALHAEAFAALRDGHLAPRRWWPRIKAPQVFRFARALLPAKPDPQRAMAAMPPLLRSYLAMGGWVSDHAVVDTGLRTMHVFTGVEIGAIPPGRRRFLHGLLP